MKTLGAFLIVLVGTGLPAFCGELQKQNPVTLRKPHATGARSMEGVPYVSPEMEADLLKKLQGDQPVEQKWLYAALGAQQTTLRAYAATALGKAGDKRAIPYLIQALSDQSMHVGRVGWACSSILTVGRFFLSLNSRGSLRLVPKFCSQVFELGILCLFGKLLNFGNELLVGHFSSG